MTIKIEKNVTVPALQRTGRNPLYPWDKMKVGDSFLFPKHVSKDMASSNSSGANTRNKKTGKHFIIRETKNGIRCWRDK